MAPADAIGYLSGDTRFTRTASSPGQRSGEGSTWGPKSARKDPRPRRAGRARSSISTWMRSTHRSNSATIRSCAASRSRSADRANAASSRPQATKRGKFGVHSAMPSITAKRKCPDLIFVKPRFDAYKAISLQIREIFAEYTPIIEPLSLDEAYLDVTENLKGIASATQIAEEIRARIRAETELTASAGVSYNKFLAKLASDHRKPDGLFVITPEMGPAFVETLPVRKFHGVGPATARKMAQLGIETGLDLRARPWPSCSSISGKRAPTITGLRAASTSGLSAPIGYASPSAPRTRFPPISSPTKPRAMRFERSSTRCGATARAPVFAAAQSRSRSSSPTSSRSREAAPVRCRSGREANSNSSATRCSNLFFLSRKAFGSWASPCLHSRRKRLNASPNSACLPEALISSSALLGRGRGTDSSDRAPSSDESSRIPRSPCGR